MMSIRISPFCAAAVFGLSGLFGQACAQTPSAGVNAKAPAPVLAPAPDANCGALREKAAAPGTGIAAKALPLDNRLVVFAYDKNALYPLNTAYGRYTHLELDPAENVLGSYGNDSTEWEITVSVTGRDIMVRPKIRNITGAWTVITDRRRYEFDLFDVSGCPGETRYQRVSFTYLDNIFENPDLARTARQGKQGTSASLPPLPGMPASSGGGLLLDDGGASAANSSDDMLVRLDALNSDYILEGNAIFRPTMVMDDGTRTVIKFPSTLAVRPVLFAVDKNGLAEVVEYTVKGSTFRVTRVFEHGALLKLGDETVTIRNKRENCGWFDSACKSVKPKNIAER